MQPSSLKKESAYDVFISYSSKNKTVVDALCHFLEEKKIRCWMAPRDILPGQNYAEAIAQAMSKVKVFILVYSNSSLSSQWVQSETNLAVSKKKIIIPFRLDDCSFEGTAMELYLNDRHWIDAIPDPAKAFGNVAEAIFSFLRITPSASTEKPPTDRRQTSENFPPAEPAAASSSNEKNAPAFVSENADKNEAEAESGIDLFLNQADACVVERFLFVKAKERGFWIATGISLFLFVVFMWCKWENMGTGAFLFFLLFLSRGIFFTIKAMLYSRKLACPFEIKYGDFKKAYLKKADEMRKAVDSVIDSFLDHADAGVVERFLSAKAKERGFWNATVISLILFTMFISCNCEKMAVGAFLFFLLFLPCEIFFMIKVFFCSRKLAFPFEINDSYLKEAYLKKADEMRKAAVKKRSFGDCNG